MHALVFCTPPLLREHRPKTASVGWEQRTCSTACDGWTALAKDAPRGSEEPYLSLPCACIVRAYKQWWWGVGAAKRFK